MKTAILIVGNVRTWDRCKANFMEAFGSLNADVFISTYGMQYAYHPWIQKTTNFQEDRVLSEREVCSKFDGLKVCSCVVDDIESYVNTTVKPFICNRFPPDAYLSLSQYFKLNDCLMRMQEQEVDSGINYDLVIKTRFDITYTRQITEMTEMNVSKTTFVDAYGAGVYPCDWVVVANRTNMLNINKFVMEEVRDMKHESSLIDMPHKLFLNGVLSTSIIECKHFVNTIVRGA